MLRLLTRRSHIVAPAVLRLGDPRLRLPSADCVLEDPALPLMERELHAALQEFRDTHGFGRAISAPQIGHAVPKDTLQSLARAAAQRRGLPDWRPPLHRARAAVSVELQRRLVAQLHRCLPQEHDDERSPDAESPPRTRVPEDEERPRAWTIWTLHPHRTVRRSTGHHPRPAATLGGQVRAWRVLILSTRRSHRALLLA